jgi:hypothetical protein
MSFNLREVDDIAYYNKTPNKVLFAEDVYEAVMRRRQVPYIILLGKDNEGFKVVKRIKAFVILSIGKIYFCPTDLSTTVLLHKDIREFKYISFRLELGEYNSSMDDIIGGPIRVVGDMTINWRGNIK